MENTVCKIVAFVFLLLPIAVMSQSWNEMPGSAVNKAFYSIYSDASGNIYAAGNFTNASGNRYVAKYDGKTWSELGGPNSLAANAYIACICSDKAGNFYAAGQFTDSTGISYVAKYDGKKWSALGGTNRLGANSQTKLKYGQAKTSQITSICTDTWGNIYAGGRFLNASGKFYVAKYDGKVWSELGGMNSLPVNGDIDMVCSDAAGNIYAAGFIESEHWFLIKYDGTKWSELIGSKPMASNAGLVSYTHDAAGNIYATSRQSDKYFLARYNGKEWSDLASFTGTVAGDKTTEGFDTTGITSVCSDASGNIYVAYGFSAKPALGKSAKLLAQGKFYITKYNGKSWSELGRTNRLNANGHINGLCSDKSGNIYAAGWFTNASDKYYVAKYTGK